MKLIISELNDALIEGGTSPDKAKAASEAVANYSKEIADIKTDLAVIKWGIGLIIIATVVPFLKSLI